MEYGEIRRIERTTKVALVAEVNRWARMRGHRWVLGGPTQWSKDELVSAVIRIREGGEA